MGLLAAHLLILNTVPAVCARKPWTDTPLNEEQQVALEKAGRLAKSGKMKAAEPFFNAAIASANDIPKLMAIANFTEGVGYPLQDVRRACLEKALGLWRTREDFITVASKARKFQLYECTRQAINGLIATAQTKEDLFDLSRKAHEVNLEDVAHLSMEKCYAVINSQADALVFAQQAKIMGMDDLVRKCLKDLLDDSQTASEICQLLKQMEPFQMTDYTRYGLKKALDIANTMDECQQICNLARRYNESDIMQLALYRYKKKFLIQKIKDDQSAYQKQVQSWKEGQQTEFEKEAQKAVQDLQRQGIKGSGF